jgi:predicted RNA binding protein YcfA (HicA-like mRNA interferase family)
MADIPGEIAGPRFLRAMGRLGWRVIRQRGSHRVLAREGGTKVLIVAFHRSLGRTSVRRVLKDAGIDEADFLRAL